MSSRRRHRTEWFAGAIVFLAFIAAHFMFGTRAAVKVLGLACVVTGVLWIFRRAVPVGIEGRAPSFYLRGWAARLAGLAIAALGVGLLTYSALAVCLLGWGADDEC